MTAGTTRPSAWGSSADAAGPRQPCAQDGLERRRQLRAPRQAAHMPIQAYHRDLARQADALPAK